MKAALQVYSNGNWRTVAVGTPKECAKRARHYGYHLTITRVFYQGGRYPVQEVLQWDDSYRPLPQD